MIELETIETWENWDLRENWQNLTRELRENWEKIEWIKMRNDKGIYRMKKSEKKLDFLP